MIEKAEAFATKVHKGQYRKDDKKTPYIEHPRAVVELLKQIGINDEDVICAAWLHDVVEDSDTPDTNIAEEFNPNIARIVRNLTRTESRSDYKFRIKNADFQTQIVKLADYVHNCYTLHEISDPVKKQIAVQNKVDDIDFYLALAKKIAPEFNNPILRLLHRYLF